MQVSRLSSQAVVTLAVAVCLAGLAIVGGGSRRRPADPLTAPPQGASAPAAPSTSASVLEARAWLPASAVTDGSVDYTSELQAALDAAAGRTLLLPPFPVLVAPRPGQKACLVVRAPTAIVGTAGSELRERTGGVQLLRCEDVHGLRLANFRLSGNGGVGRSLAHGTLQITRGSDVRVEGLTIEDADADALAVSQVTDLIVTGCFVRRASKAGLYVTQCERVVLTGNVVSDTLGHVIPDGRTVGAAVQLWSNREVVCADNVLVRGVGAGIYVSANAKAGAPLGTTIADNRIAEFRNGLNEQVSGGILLTNPTQDAATHTLVTGNSVAACGAHGLFLTGHDGALIANNSVVCSEGSGVVVEHARGVVLQGNAIHNSDTLNQGGQAHIELRPTAERVQLSDNVLRNLPGHPQGYAEFEVLGKP